MQLGDILIAMGLLTAEQLAEVMNTAPAVPANLEETGISPRSLLNLMLKFMLIEGCETVLDLAERLKLPRRGVQQLIDDAVQQRLIQAVGAAPGGLALSIRHALSETGRAAAKEALDQNLYLGPAPVNLQAYQDQVLGQRISNEQLDADALRQGFAGLVVPAHYIRKLLPAVNGGRRCRCCARRDRIAPRDIRSALGRLQAACCRDRRRDDARHARSSAQRRNQVLRCAAASESPERH